MKVLVTGGAGYIGAHVARALEEAAHEPVVLDDLRASRRSRVGHLAFEKVALEDTASVLEVFDRHRPEAVIHLAGSISVGESVAQPEKYWNNNLGAANSLLVAAARHPLSTFVFSSTAAVYGDVEKTPIAEETALRPTSPYGASKLAFERRLHAAAPALGLRSVALRFFNAAGAVVGWGVGEQHEPEEHLIPRIIGWLRAGQPVNVFGDDYPTDDGTCVRDYVHVGDLARAHVLALERAPALDGPISLNIGTGRGASVRDVIATVGRELGIAPRIEIGPRRPGDPPVLVADPSAAREKLGFVAEHDLERIVADAVAWDSIRQE